MCKNDIKRGDCDQVYKSVMIRGASLFYFS